MTGEVATFCGEHKLAKQIMAKLELKHTNRAAEVRGNHRRRGGNWFSKSAIVDRLESIEDSAVSDRRIVPVSLR